MSQLDCVNTAVGIDVNPKAVNFARETLSQTLPEAHRKKLRFEASNLVSLVHEESKSFDFAFSNEMLEHIYPDDVNSVMTEMTRLVRPGGHFLMCLPHKDSFAWEALHVFKPTLEELDALFVRHGWSVVESYVDKRSGPTMLTGLYKKE